METARGEDFAEPALLGSVGARPNLLFAATLAVRG